MRLDYKCPTCSRPAEVQSELPMSGGLFTFVYRCGHIEIRKKDAVNSNVPAENKNIITRAIDDSYRSVDFSKCCYDYQVDGVNFVEKADFNALIADATGLGKTIQGLVVLKRNKKLFPVLIVVKGAITFQWARQFKTWVDDKPLRVMPIINRDSIIPGCDAYIISRDLIGRKGVADLLLPLGIKFVIIDEVHNFKNPSSLRTRGLITFLQNAEIQYKLGLSATPIKNRADEYFTILNLLAPQYFRSRESFRRDWLITNEKGVYTRINPYRLDKFHELTSRWIIRREKHEVLKHLPKLTRDYQFVEIDDPQVKETYNKQLDLFSNFLKDHKTGITSTDLLGWLASLRAITGSAKSQAAIDFCQEFLDSTDEVMTVGIQHKAVRDTLYYVFQAAGYEPLKYSGEDSAYAKDRIMQRFRSQESRLLIMNMQAGGEGVDIEFCPNALVLERQWNAADEEQFEGRFHRDGAQSAITVTYMMAKGTIDEWFHNMVELKRKICGETVSKDWALTQDTDSLMDLARQTISNRL